MSIPQWKVALREKQQRKKEEEKKKKQEEEKRRLEALPPWKRHLEQPKTVIFIDKNKVASEVDLSGSSDSIKQNNNSTLSTTMVNGSAPTVTSSTGESRLGLGSDRKIGGDETDSGPGGVSEEHCTSVSDNPFLKLERKKRRAPLPPTTGSQINVIASNVPGKAIIGDKHTNSGRKAVAESESAKKSTTISNSIQQSTKETSLSDGGNQIQDSTMTKVSLNLKQKQDNVPKMVVSPAKVVNKSNVTSSAKDDVTTGTEETTTFPNPPGSNANVVSPQSKERDLRRSSISDLRNLFDGLASSKGKMPSSNQTVQSNPKANLSSETTGLLNNKSNKSQIGASNAKTATDEKKSNLTSDHTQSMPHKISVLAEERKKNDINSKNKNVGGSLPVASKDSSVRQKPSSELPASEIISLTNEGPLQDQKGKLIRISSVIDDEEEVALIPEIPCSPTRGRLTRDEKAKDSVEGKSVASEKGASPGKRRGPSAPQSLVIIGSMPNIHVNETHNAEEKSKSVETAKDNDVEDQKNEISYPKNFRDPNYVPKQPKTEKEMDTKSSPVKSAQVAIVEEKKVSEHDNNVTGKTVRNTDATHSTSYPNGEDEIKGSPEILGTEMENGNKPGGSKETPKEKTFIPYPSDFRRFGTLQSSDNSKDKKRDIVKPSELIKPNNSSASNKKDEPAESGGGTTMFGGMKLRSTKQLQTGINVIAQNKTRQKSDRTGKQSSSSLVVIGSGESNASGDGKNKNLKKFEKVEFIGYNSPSGKPSALKKTGSTPKKTVKFHPGEEEVFQYLSEEASILEYDEQRQGDAEEEEKRASETKQASTLSNGLNNGIVSEGSDDEEASSLKNDSLLKSSAFQNMASASSVSATDLLLGRVRPQESREPLQPTPPPEPEPQSDHIPMSLTAGDIFSSVGQGSAALLF